MSSIRLLAVLALVASACCTLHKGKEGYKKEQPVEYFVARTVRVKTERGFGSGVILQPHIILTAWHVVSGRQDFTVLKKWRNTWLSSKARQVYHDSELDLAILSTEHTFVYSSPVRESPVSVDTRVVSAGYPWDRVWRSGERLLFSRGRIVAVGDGHYRHSAVIYLGSSGGGVWDVYGNLICLSQWGVHPFPGYYGSRHLVRFLQDWKAKGSPGIRGWS